MLPLPVNHVELLRGLALLHPSGMLAVPTKQLEFTRRFKSYDPSRILGRGDGEVSFFHSLDIVAESSGRPSLAIELSALGSNHCRRPIARRYFRS